MLFGKEFTKKPQGELEVVKTIRKTSQDFLNTTNQTAMGWLQKWPWEILALSEDHRYKHLRTEKQSDTPSVHCLNTV